jgi:uncharacterized membrane-anchored protein
MLRTPLLPYLLTLLCLLAGGPFAAPPATAETGPSEPAAAEFERAIKAAGATLRRGPAEVSLAGQALLHLPAGYSFVPAREARRILDAMGNVGNDAVEGMIFPEDETRADWFIVASYIDSGYIRDDDARDWKADQMLETIRSSTEKANEERRERGVPGIAVVGWVEPPRYDAATHRLAWSLESRLEGQPAADSNTVNYNTLALGRQGFISLNLVTERSEVQRLRPVAEELLAALEFDAGKRYADFNEDSDRVAEYGLAALVAGVAAKKLGLFAVAAVFLAKFGKALVALAVVGLGLLGKQFGKRNKGDHLEG